MYDIFPTYICDIIEKYVTYDEDWGFVNIIFPEYIWNIIHEYVIVYVSIKKFATVSKKWRHVFNHKKPTIDLHNFFMPLLKEKNFIKTSLDRYSLQDRKDILEMEKIKWNSLSTEVHFLNAKHNLGMNREKIERMITITYQIWKTGQFDAELIIRSIFPLTWDYKLK